MPGLALLQFAQKIFLSPVEVRLLVHFRAALARRHVERANVDAIRLRALQQRDMAERRRNRFERRHQIAQHQIVGSDLVRIAPAVDQVRCFIERGIDEMGCTSAELLRPACIAPDRSGRSIRGGRHRVRAACGAIAQQFRSRRLRRSAAVRHFPPAQSRPQSPLSCRPLKNSRERIAAFTSRRPQAASAPILVFRRVRRPRRSVFRQSFAAAAEPEPLIIDHQFVILPSGP